MKINKKDLFVLTRKSIYLSLYSVDRLLMRKNNLFILCYHSFSEDDWFYSVNVENLKQQINILKKQGYDFITLDEVYDHIKGVKSINKPSVVITIDDGYSDVVSTLDIFEKEYIKPALFLVSNVKGVNRIEMDSDKKLLSAEELKIIKNKGWEIGSHAATHTKLTNLPEERLMSEIFEPKKVLESSLNQTIKYFAYPFGGYNDQVLKYVNLSRYRMALSMDDGKIDRKTDLLRVPRIGVNNTHSINEFKTLYSPSVVGFRKIVKKIIN